MQPYATKLDLTTRFGELEICSLEDPDNTGAPDVAISDQSLVDATEECNSYVGVRFSFPLPTVPEPLVRACCDIARFRLYKDRPTEEVKYRYERTIKWLEQVASGKAVLVFQPSLTEAEKEELKGASVAIGTTYQGGVFGSEITDKMLSL